MNCPCALDLPHALVQWVTVLIVTREGERRRKLRPSQRAMVDLVHLHEHTTLVKIAAGFGISEATAHAYVHSVTDLLAGRAPSLTRAGTSRRRKMPCPEGHKSVWPMSRFPVCRTSASQG